MQARFIHDGDSIDHTPEADIAAGQVIVQGDLVGIAKLDIAAGTLGALATVGVFEFPKASGDGGIDCGANAYWDEAEGVAKTDAEAGANKRIGKAVTAAGDTDTTVRIRLSQ